MKQRRQNRPWNKEDENFDILRKVCIHFFKENMAYLM